MKRYKCIKHTLKLWALSCEKEKWLLALLDPKPREKKRIDSRKRVSQVWRKMRPKGKPLINVPQEENLGINMGIPLSQRGNKG